MTGDFSATISWGDGGTSAGTVSDSGGTFTVSGSHTYGDERMYPLSVAVNGAGQSLDVTTQATIVEEQLSDGGRGSANQRYINEIYRDVLFRAAEPEGREWWVSHLTRGESRSQVAFEIVKLAYPREFQRDTVDSLCQRYLHRDPDAAGKEFWTAYIYDGGTLEAFQQALIDSPEYWSARAGGTADGFLDAVFQDVLHRPVDAPTRAQFGAAMIHGLAPPAVVALVFASDEYRRDQVNVRFEQFLDRPADPGALDFFAGQLARGVHDEQVIAELMATDEYFAKVSA